MSPSGYESDTGERDNPTYRNFKTDTPVVKTIKLGHSDKALNREGRATCRIVYAHGDYNVNQIARIFGLPRKRISKAIDNGYFPADKVSEDYAHIRDPKFAVHFPPDSGSTADEDSEEDGSVDSDEEDDDSDSESEAGNESDSDVSHCGADDERNTIPTKRKLHDEDSSGPPPMAPRMVKKPRYFGDNDGAPDVRVAKRSCPPGSKSTSGTSTAASPAPNPSRSSTSNQDTHAPEERSELLVFLKSLSTKLVDDLPERLALLSSQGFTIERLRIMAQRWPNELIAEALERGLMGGELELGIGGCRGLTSKQVVGIEVGLMKMRRKLPVDFLVPADRRTLHAFLGNVMGFDLTACYSLFQEQGFVCADGELRKVKAVVGRDGGISVLDGLAVEFALRDICY
ncbi:hypothetical protein FB45DRAFT_906827 [Roridomyces roridus]|uniref:Uncharacterized protein n=1 Tax=Roridomyces roridus TaxID=1738132 RepID=A0AAD7C1D7_9AGAR|nr:hypothetical protein FB45DRAFT_906827 [Roridomyces roridus]